MAAWRSPDGAWSFLFKYQPPSVLDMSFEVRYTRGSQRNESENTKGADTLRKSISDHLSLYCRYHVDVYSFYNNLTVPSGRYDIWTFLHYITHDQTSEKDPSRHYDSDIGITSEDISIDPPPITPNNCLISKYTITTDLVANRRNKEVIVPIEWKYGNTRKFEHQSEETTRSEILEQRPKSQEGKWTLLQNVLDTTGITYELVFRVPNVNQQDILLYTIERKGRSEGPERGLRERNPKPL
ncbi:hypothetical protein OSB04_029085 [Centaurea solstitialis]|uniref:Uncharacterized protein n=1 Tax=Centaurea solstitialis TaxID=347529 RepID=A0AA38SGX0_9ASTR|nr:hypothetical protein OSB04_029085 [Centaurea solstitialis]